MVKNEIKTYELPLDLTNELDMESLRTKAWDFEIVLRNFYRRAEESSPGPFSTRRAASLFWSGDSISWVYHLKNGGLTLRPFENLEQGVVDKMPMSREDYDSIQNVCNKFTDTVLTKMYTIGKLNDNFVGRLDDAFICVGDMGGPEEVSFKNEYGFYLKPGNVLNFLCGDNGDGGPMELYFRYNLCRYDDKNPKFQELELQYDPVKKMVKVQDIGFYKMVYSPGYTKQSWFRHIKKPVLATPTPLDKLLEEKF